MLTRRSLFQMLVVVPFVKVFAKKKAPRETTKGSPLCFDYPFSLGIVRSGARWNAATDTAIRPPHFDNKPSKNWLAHNEEAADQWMRNIPPEEIAKFKSDFLAAWNALES